MQIEGLARPDPVGSAGDTEPKPVSPQGVWIQEPFQSILLERISGKVGRGANRFSSLRSILPHPGAPSPGGRLEGSRTGTGQPKGAWHPPPRFAAARTQERLPSAPLLSALSPRGSGGSGSPHPLPPRGPVPGSRTCLHQVSPHFTPPAPSPTATPFHLATRLSSQPTFLSPGDRTWVSLSVTQGNNLYHIYPNVVRRPKKEVRYNTDYF